MEQQIGNILSASTHTAYCQFGNGQVQEGSVVYFRHGPKKVSGRVVYLYISPHKGTLGNVTFDAQLTVPPRPTTELYMDASAPKEPGVWIELGKDPFDRPVRVRLNAIFRNVLLTGITQSGKTHLAIVMAEDLARLKVPHLIFDTQDEFLGLREKYDNVEVVAHPEDTRETLALLKGRKTAIVSLMGLSPAEKSVLVRKILERVFDAKERSYKHDPRLYPPIITTIDEAEVYAPSNYTIVQDRACRKQIENLVKRGVKFGMGTILVSQRPTMLYDDVRSQCKSAMLFLLTDGPSINAVKLLPYVTRFDIETIRKLRIGECLATGDLVMTPVRVAVRQIQVHRTKNVDFEQLLDLPIDFPEPVAPATRGGARAFAEERSTKELVDSLKDYTGAKSAKLDAIVKKALPLLKEKGSESMRTVDVVDEGRSSKELARKLKLAPEDVESALVAATAQGHSTPVVGYEVSGLTYWFRNGTR